MAWLQAIQGKGRLAIPQIQAPADQPQRGKANGCCHAPHLTVAAFSELELQPTGGHAEPVADWWIALSDGTGDRWIQQLGPRWAAGAVFELDAPPERFEICFCWCPLHLGPVLAPVAKAWVGELMLQLAVAGEQ